MDQPPLIDLFGVYASCMEAATDQRLFVVPARQHVPPRARKRARDFEHRRPRLAELGGNDESLSEGIRLADDRSESSGHGITAPQSVASAAVYYGRRATVG